MGMTMCEKIIARHAGRSEVTPGEYVWCKADATQGGMLARLESLGIEKVWDNERVYIVEDHLAPPPTIAAANNMVQLRRLVKKYNITNFFEYGRHGILHQVFPENGMIAPGELIPMPDSHSTTGGAFNACATNAAMDSLLVLIFGEYWLRVPESVRINLVGKYAGPDSFFVGKDIVLYIAGQYGTDMGLYKSLEYLGPVAHQMELSSRMTISNMGVELGAKFAIFECDDKTIEWLNGRVKRPYYPVAPDQDARYAEEYTIDVTDMPPQVACPHDPGNVRPVTELEPERIKVNQAFIGSCTNGRMEDFRMAARVLKGRKIHPDVRLIASPASQSVWREALQEGIWDIFSAAGALVAHSTCGPCYGGHLGVLGDGEVSIASSNRNFQGRQGSPDSFVYLANPATVAASAVAGYITDPRQFL